MTPLAWAFHGMPWMTMEISEQEPSSSVETADLASMNPGAFLGHGEVLAVYCICLHHLERT